MIVAQVIFWFCAACMVHSYVLYPLLLQLLASGKQQNQEVFTADDANLPNLYIVFAAYNEERILRQKLESVFATTYPAHKFSVLVGSDNSSDSTNAILAEFAAKHPQLNWVNFPGRTGKSGIVNQLVASLQPQYNPGAESAFVFTDANVLFTPATLFQLAKHFRNPAIGQVGANVLNRGMQADGISVQEEAYIQRENRIKYWEGLNWGTMMGAFGACYAMRCNLWTPIPKAFLMEDFYLSLHILKTGSQAIFEMQAVCYEDVSNELQEEYKRKTRIQAGNWQNLGVYWPLLLKPGALSFTFLSHKVLRWLGPVFIALAYGSNLALIAYSPFYLTTFVIQNLFLISPVLDGLLNRIGIHNRLLRFVAYFCSMNMALVSGFIMYAKGINTSAWSPTKRNLD